MKHKQKMVQIRVYFCLALNSTHKLTDIQFPSFLGFICKEINEDNTDPATASVEPVLPEQRLSLSLNFAFAWVPPFFDCPLFRSFPLSTSHVQATYLCVYLGTEQKICTCWLSEKLDGKCLARGHEVPASRPARSIPASNQITLFLAFTPRFFFSIFTRTKIRIVQSKVSATNFILFFTRAVRCNIGVSVTFGRTCFAGVNGAFVN